MLKINERIEREETPFKSKVGDLLESRSLTYMNPGSVIGSDVVNMS